jgi:hypothetical protein
MASEPYEDASSVPSASTDDPPHAVSSVATTYRATNYDTTGMWVMGETDLSSGLLWDNEQVGRWSDEGSITIVLGGVTTHLPSYSRDQVAGPP